jgi:hypothetical protein
MRPIRPPTQSHQKFKPIFDQKIMPRYKSSITDNSSRINKSSRRNNHFSNLKLSDVEPDIFKSLKSVTSPSRKSAMKMDKALHSNKFFKPKDLKLRNSEYSFYDRGFKEYTYHPLKKTRVRPSTAGVQREQGGKLAKFNTL